MFGLIITLFQPHFQIDYEEFVQMIAPIVSEGNKDDPFAEPPPAANSKWPSREPAPVLTSIWKPNSHILYGQISAGSHIVIDYNWRKEELVQN